MRPYPFPTGPSCRLCARRSQPNVRLLPIRHEHLEREAVENIMIRFLRRYRSPARTALHPRIQQRLRKWVYAKV